MRPVAAPLALVAALLVALPAARAGAGRPEGEPGVTPTSVLLGGTAPLTGSASVYAAVARGAGAYFAYVNARGGVHGRRIVYRYLDDAHDPARALDAVRRLVEQDRVFAIFNSIGTGPTLAVRGYLEAVQVPQLFAASGATTLGRDVERHPRTIGFRPGYQPEGRVYGSYLARARPDARVAVLAQDDDDGRDLLAGLRRGIARSTVRVVAVERFEPTAPDVHEQIAALRASGADTLALFASPTFALQSYAAARRLRWRPHVLLTSLSSAADVLLTASAGGANGSVEGTVSATFLKDPTDPVWRNDPGMRLYRSILAVHGKGAQPGDVQHVYGMAVAHALVDVLRKTGPALTRAHVLRQARSLTIPASPFLLPGVRIRTEGVDQFPIEQLVLQRWRQGRWRAFGGLWGRST